MPRTACTTTVHSGSWNFFFLSPLEWKKALAINSDLDLLNSRQGVEYKVEIMRMGSEQYWVELPLHHQAHYSHRPSDAFSALWWSLWTAPLDFFTVWLAVRSGHWGAGSPSPTCLSAGQDMVGLGSKRPPLLKVAVHIQGSLRQVFVVSVTLCPGRQRIPIVTQLWKLWCYPLCYPLTLPSPL